MVCKCFIRSVADIAADLLLVLEADRSSTFLDRKTLVWFSPASKFSCHLQFRPLWKGESLYSISASSIRTVTFLQCKYTCIFLSNRQCHTWLPGLWNWALILEYLRMYWMWTHWQAKLLEGHEDLLLLLINMSSEDTVLSGYVPSHPLNAQRGVMGQLLYAQMIARHVFIINLISGTVFPVGELGGKEIPSLPRWTYVVQMSESTWTIPKETMIKTAPKWRMFLSAASRWKAPRSAGETELPAEKSTQAG